MPQRLLEIGHPDHRLSREYLETPGGFAWWYADLLDEDGNGVVLIWSFGLPFLPDYANNARRGRSEIPRTRPSLNVAVYEKGTLAFYLLQEYVEADAAWSEDGASWKFGNSQFRTSTDGARRRLEISLDAPVPGSEERLRAQGIIEGVQVAHDVLSKEHEQTETLSIHDWAPLAAPASGTINLQVGDRSWEVTGRAYHDRNGAKLPLHELGMSHWLWGRIPFSDREVVFYLLWPETAEREAEFVGLVLHDDGRIEHLDDLVCVLGDERRAFAGMPFWNSLALTRHGETWLEVEYEDVVDDGPFYLRFHVTGRIDDEQAKGFAEACRPDRVDRDIHRPLVRMRVHHVNAQNSIWLPLFTGPKRGRVRRLVRSWLRGAS